MSEAPRPQEGTWTLTAPDGRQWTGMSPIDVAGQELRERVPPSIRAKRMMGAVFLDDPPAHTEYEDCWCSPELDYEDPATGNQVWVHRDIE